MKNLGKLAIAAFFAVYASACGGVGHGPIVQGSGKPCAVYGEGRVAEALGAIGSRAPVRVALATDAAAMQALASAGVTLDAKPESYAIVQLGQETLIVGRDDAGALYGGLELAERVRLDGPGALPLRAPIVGAPATPIRGANLFLVLPKRGEKGWWFLEKSFWTEYLDLLARSRINFLDLHGMYNPDNTLCPNALLYFAGSTTYPDAGVPLADRERNLTMLAEVVEMARERGIKVGLMSYRTDLSVRAEKTRKKKGDISGDALKVYTKEAVKNIAERVPGLWRLGFRIGESKQPARWFKDTFVAGVDEAKAPTLLSTRTWMTKKAEIVDLVTATKRDTLVEAKYNGEQMGPPYVIAGGLMALKSGHWSSYSYEDYLDDPTPYSFIFHIWGGGSNRVFRYASHERIRRTVGTTQLGAARGFSMMPTHTFYPQYDFWHKDPADRYSPWAFRRDELEYLLFGRLGYAPETPVRVFREALKQRVGTDALWDPMQAASDIVPWIQTAHTCGSDQRQFAPELEWGGTVAFWASDVEPPDVMEVCKSEYHGPFDRFAVASPFEAARDLVDGRGTSKLSPLEVARIVLDDARRAREAAKVAVDARNAEARDVVRESIALADLGEYFGHKLRGATALAVYARTGRADYLAEARAETTLADQAWIALGRDTAYIRPFEEKMRMGLKLGFPVYHWSLQSVQGDMPSIEDVVARSHARARGATALPAKEFLDAPRGEGPGLAELDVQPDGVRWRVTAKFLRAVPEGARVRVLSKPLSGLTDWQDNDASGTGTVFTATFDRRDSSGFFAVEVVGEPGAGWRYPDVLKQTPYIVVKPAAGASR